MQTKQEVFIPTRPMSPVRVLLYRIYIVLALLFLIGVAIQVFLAGAGIFVTSGSWFDAHKSLGSWLALPPLLLLIVAIAGRAPRSVNWLSLLLLVLVAIQPFLIFWVRKVGLPIVLSAFHPVNALAIFTLPIFLIVRLRNAMRAAAILDKAN